MRGTSSAGFSFSKLATFLFFVCGVLTHLNMPGTSGEVALCVIQCPLYKVASGKRLGLWLPKLLQTPGLNTTEHHENWDARPSRPSLGDSTCKGSRPGQNPSGLLLRTPHILTPVGLQLTNRPASSCRLTRKLQSWKSTRHQHKSSISLRSPSPRNRNTFPASSSSASSLAILPLFLGERRFTGLGGLGT